MNHDKSSDGQWPCPRVPAAELIEALTAVREDVLHKAEEFLRVWDSDFHPAFAKSAVNFVHYLAFRLHDLRALQLKLSEWGLSSLGRAERKVEATLDSVLEVLHRLEGRPWQPDRPPLVCHREGRALLEAHTDALFGPGPGQRRVRIMVTLPTEAADEPALIEALMRNGMNVARINTAHDDPQRWERMVRHVHEASQLLGHPCTVFMDLAGPKIRTGPIAPGPEVWRVRVRKDDYGRVVAPARVWLFPKGASGEAPVAVDAALPVEGAWSRLRPGMTIRFRDSRQARRRLYVEAVYPSGVLALLDKTAWVYSGMGLEVKDADFALRLGRLPAKEGVIRLYPGDVLQIWRRPIVGQPAGMDEEGQWHPARIACTLPEALAHAEPGQPIWFDDGKIGGRIEAVHDDRIEVRITHARARGERLRAGKGINLPDTRIELPALTERDREVLPFVARHADMVGLSFVHRESDVDELLALLQQHTPPDRPLPGIVLKIETRRAFDNLPRLVLSAMQTDRAGVMIARGDLAIESGFERLAEVQEEVLWLCEAAHMPVIWATQVLETMARQGLPARAEISDAAMGQRAECIMLNKGPFIVEATRTLDDILRRMQDHQTKKRSLLRRLRVAEQTFAGQACEKDGT